MSALRPRLVDAASVDADAMLACLRFDREAPEQARVHRVPLLRQGADLLEVWPAAGPVRRFEQHGYACADDGEHLFFWRIDDESQDIESAAENAYRDLLALCAHSGYPQLLRIWNYFDRVTAGEGDDERYRRFCVGRHRALESPDFERRLPAATVIGTQSAGLQLYGFASRTAGVQVENPRQTSAFRYPREYGERSPSFSRATRYGDVLLMSGTAAIVGHQTQHPHDVMLQTQAMLDNVQALLASAARAGERWQPLALRLYLKDSADAHRVLARVRDVLGDDTGLLVVQGEVCRRDLQVEIEGVFAAR